MKLFISYARVDKPYCIQIAEALGIHEVWYDSRLYVGQNWWEEILWRLAWCDGFVYLLSPESISSEYCVREMQLALQMGKPIFPVKIVSDTIVPEEIATLQYADMSNGLTLAAGSTLLNAIYLSERTMMRIEPVKPVTNGNGNGHHHNVVMSEPLQAEVLPLNGDVNAIVGKSAEALEAGQYDEAYFLLKRAIEHGLTAMYVDLEQLLREAEIGLEEDGKRREREREYRSIAQLVKLSRTRAIGCQSFMAFHNDYPEYDPDNLLEICESELAATTAFKRVKAQPRPSIPMLEWCEIPHGALNVIIERNGEKQRESLQIDSYKLSKYPVTNAQYQLFIEDQNGYAHPRWWDYSPFALKWHEDNHEPLESKFHGDERPRENVTWYEAMAFCNWLSDRLGTKIGLPTRQQWQRAARGDDSRIYPWGNEFDTSLCNALESKIHQTTMVMRYVKGVSAYGVYDMAGNVWEWCLNGAYDDCDPTTERPRAVQGGSFMSAHERAQNGFHFPLNPESRFGSIGFRIATTID
jgi:formylglycine-generating enzyme required for sulfatase activity